MAQMERVVYLNGEFIPESRAGIPIRDRGFVLGDAVFDTARTFNGRPFKLPDHIDRLFDSCRYLRLDPGLTRDEFLQSTNELLERNLPLLGPREDFWVTQRVTRGADPIGPDDEVRPTVLIECKPLPLAKRAKGYRDGLALLTPSIPRTAPRFMSPSSQSR